MADATVLLPRLLEPAVGDVRRVEVQGDTLGAALDDLLTRLPALRAHLFDERGGLRSHVLCIVDGQATRLTNRDLPLAPGTQIAFLQAVSGG